MKAAVRGALTCAVIAAACWAVYSCAYEPMQCEVTTTLVTRSTQRVLARSDPFNIAPIARNNIERLRPCLEGDPRQVDAYMVAAANFRLLGQDREAARMYEAALQFDRRPELYLNLGTVQLALGDRKAAIENLVRARVFNQFVESEVPPEVREEVRKRAIATLPDRR